MNLEILKVIKIEICEGKGTKDDLMRTVTYYYTVDGEFIFKNDPCDEINKVEE